MSYSVLNLIFKKKFTCSLFQSLFHLEVTGKLNDDTLDQMMVGFMR